MGSRSLKIEYPADARILLEASSHRESSLTFVPGYSPGSWLRAEDASECVSTPLDG